MQGWRSEQSVLALVGRADGPPRSRWRCPPQPLHARRHRFEGLAGAGFVVRFIDDQHVEGKPRSRDLRSGRQTSRRRRWKLGTLGSQAMR